MHRRKLLGLTASVGAIGLAGCLTRMRLLGCNIAPWDQNTDWLEAAKAPSDVGQHRSVVIIQYSELSPREQRVVKKAIAKGSYVQCHEFGGEPNGIMALNDRIQRRWSEEDLESSKAAFRTYIAYEDDYYGIELGELDQIFVQSIPYPCNVNDDCDTFTSTPKPIPTKES